GGTGGGGGASSESDEGGSDSDSEDDSDGGHRSKKAKKAKKQKQQKPNGAPEPALRQPVGNTGSKSGARAREGSGRGGNRWRMAAAAAVSHTRVSSAAGNRIKGKEGGVKKVNSKKGKRGHANVEDGQAVRGEVEFDSEVELGGAEEPAEGENDRRHGSMHSDATLESEAPMLPSGLSGLPPRPPKASR
ncbi:hypothetical protein CYMTET_50649, partial [Cymbomonas tetramitiformis]